MFELRQVTERCFYIQAPAKIGIVKLDDEHVCLIDSGSDKDAARRIRQIIEKNNWTLSAIYITHSHADHIGGNHYLQARTGCPVYAPGIEGVFTNHTILEPAFLYGGAPPSALKHKFLYAKESHVVPLTPEALPHGMEMIPLRGHSFDMVGYRTPDDVVFLADSVCSAQTLEKYKISYLYDPKGFLDTLERIKSMTARLFIPSHADAMEDIVQLAQLNIESVHQTAQLIQTFLETPKTFEVLLSEIFQWYGLAMNFKQYVLLGNTLRSYLAWLNDDGKITYSFSKNQMLWKTDKTLSE